MPCSGCPTRTARSLRSFSPPSVPCQSSTTDSQSYSLQIPLDKDSAHPTLLAARMVSLVSSDKPKTLATAAKESPTHHLCLFSSNLWEDFPTPRAQWFLLASLPAMLPPPCLTPLVLKSSAFCLTLLAATTWFPSSWIQWLPSTMIKCPLRLWLQNFSSPSKHYVPTNPATALPTPPEVSNEIVTIYRLPGFILAICYPSRYFYCTSGCAISASETAWWGGAENLNKGKR